MEPMASPQRSNQTFQRSKWVALLLGLLMTTHLSVLGFRSDDTKEFQQAAETYVTVLLALLAPSPIQ